MPAKLRRDVGEGRRAHKRLLGKPGAVGKHSVHPQLIRPGIHPLYKGRLASGNLFRQRAGRVVG